MKKFLVIMLTFFAMSIGVLAEKGTLTLTEYLGIADKKENVDSICMYSERAFNNGDDFYVSPDTEEFFELADSIVLTDVENTPMKVYEEESITPGDSLYIEVHFADGNMTFALMSALGEVDKYLLVMSRLPATDCVTDKENFLKLEELYDSLLAEKREKLALPYKSSVYGGDTESADPVPETEDAEQMPLPITDETEIQSDSTDDADIGEQYNPYALVIVVALMAAAVALTMVLNKKK